jgi:stage II sporulation protein Q
MYKLNINVKTLNRGEKMKRIILYSIYSICFVLMLSVVIAYNSIDKESNNTSNASVDYDYVYDIMDTSVQQVNKETSKSINKPYSDKNVKIVKNFYNYKSDEKEQQNSIIYYEGSYMQSSGVSYSSGSSFPVLAIQSGEVTEVKNDELVGNSITIKHSDNTFSVYQSILDIKVKKGDVVNAGDVIATSGISNLEKDLGNHLYFELIINGSNVNPEEYYGSEL